MLLILAIKLSCVRNMTMEIQFNIATFFFIRFVIEDMKKNIGKDQNGDVGGRQSRVRESSLPSMYATAPNQSPFIEDWVPIIASKI